MLLAFWLGHAHRDYHGQASQQRHRRGVSAHLDGRLVTEVGASQGLNTALQIGGGLGLAIVAAAVEAIHYGTVAC